MRKWAFILFICGMVVLFLIYAEPGVEVGNLEGLEVNERVIVEGKVIEQRGIYFGTMLLTLETGIEVVCECIERFEGRNVRVEGVVSEYEDTKQVNAEKIFIID